jgi:nitrate reductase gamma subunit
MPHWAFILSAELAFAGLLLLWLHRLLNPVTRLLSDLDDHMGTILVFLVMLSGCLALAQSFEVLRLLHLLLAELLLLYFPFSKLMHAFTFAISRGYTGAAMGRKGVNA